MIEILKNFFKQSFSYGIANIINKSSSFILLPLYTHYLSVSQYGNLEILLITYSFLLVLFQFGIGSAVMKSVLYDPIEEKKIIISTAFIFHIIALILIAFILIPLSKPIALLLFKNIEFNLYVKILFISVILNSLIAVPLALLRIEEKSKSYILLTAISSLSELGFNFFFLVYLKLGIEGIMLSILLKSIIIFIYFMILMKSEIVTKFSKSVLKEILFFGMPLIPAGIASMILTISDRYFLKFMAPPIELGLYSLGYRIGLLMALLINSFQLAWPTIMYKIADEKNAKAIFSKITTIYLIFLLFISLILSIYSKEIIEIISASNFHSAYRIVPFILISYVFFGFYYMTSIGINLKKKTKYEPLIVGSSALINLILNYLLIPAYGMYGAAIATLLSYMILVFLSIHISNKFFKINYNYHIITAIFLLTMIISIMANTIYFSTELYNYTFKFFLLFSFPLFLFISGIIKSSDIKGAFKIVQT